MKYLSTMCSCLLCAISGGAISPPEEAAEQMHAGTADAGLEKTLAMLIWCKMDGWMFPLFVDM